MKIINLNNQKIETDLQYNINSFCYFVSDFIKYQKDVSIDEALINILQNSQIDFIIKSKDVYFFESDFENEINFKFNIEGSKINFLVYYTFSTFHIDIATFEIPIKKLVKFVTNQKMELV